MNPKYGAASFEARGVLLLPVLLALSLVLLFLPPAAAQLPPSPKPLSSLPDLSHKSVLILHSYSYEQRVYMIMDPIIVKGLMDAGLDPNKLYFEYMDLARHPDLEYRQGFLQYLRHKFEKQTVDLIIVLHPDAFSASIRENDLLPGVPVINVLADARFKHLDYVRSRIDSLDRLSRLLLILPFAVDARATADNILQLQPGTRKIVVISGSAASDHSLEVSVRSDLQDWHETDVEYMSDLTVEEFLRSVASMEQDTAVLYTSVLADSTGAIYNPESVGKMICKAAGAPVFGLFETLLGDGIVGGALINQDSEARRTVRLALEILSKKLHRERKTMVLPPALVLVFDWLQLRRWGMSESTLPQGSVLLNAPISSWDKYEEYIIGGVVLLIAQSVLILGLLLQRRHRRKAEAALRRVNDELERRNLELESFTFAASHDLQEPLRKIQVFGDVIASRHGGTFSDEVCDYINRMRETAGRMQEVLRSLLRYSRLTSKVEAFGHADLNAVAKGVLAGLELQIRETQATFEIGALPEIEADAGQMAQLLQNLLENALKYRRREERPRVRIRADWGANDSRLGKCEIIVEDNGIGFEEKYLDKIFQPFQRLHGREEYPGIGMGLAICRKIVERHHGTITAKSTPGKGSTFIITLPLGREWQ